MSFARAEDLPPPPEAIDMPAIGSESGADLPPLPETIPEDQPMLSAEAPAQSPAPEEAPLPEAVPIDEQAAESAPSSDGLTEIAPSQSLESPTYSAPRPSLATRTNLMDLGVEERLKAKELVLWLTLGASYGAISPKGEYAGTSTTATNPGGMGYSAGIGWLLAQNLQMSLDFVGTPRTETTTVDSGMIGLGPRLGFLYAMVMIGTMSGEDLAHVGGGKTQLFGYGLKGGMDLVLGHSGDSRVSYGIAPEVYYSSSQAESGYSTYGATVNFRIYGYENAF